MAQTGGMGEDSESVGEAETNVEDSETFNAMQALHEMWLVKGEAGGIGAQEVA